MLQMGTELPQNFAQMAPQRNSSNMKDAPRVAVLHQPRSIISGIYITITAETCTEEGQSRMPMTIIQLGIANRAPVQPLALEHAPREVAHYQEDLCSGRFGS